MPRKKVLLIDDEVDFVELLKINLEYSGDYEVASLSDPTKAIALINSFKPDIIFLDIIMPDFNGFELLDEISADKYMKDIPVVFVTAAALNEELVETSKFMHGRPLLNKPIEIEQIIEKIEEYVK
ncbi:MAG: response regulator [Candidatus Omnitrophota bacterium]